MPKVTAVADSATDSLVIITRTCPAVKPSARNSPISRVRWMTASDIVLTKPTAAIAEETITMQIMTTEL